MFGTKKDGLKGKVAIVTGGIKGIGRGIADSLSDRGCKIVVADIAEEHSPYFFVKCDISGSADVDNLVSQTIKKYGRLDILVNNAGIYPYKSFKEMSEEDWDKVMSINLKGTFLCTKAALPFLEKQKKGKIINIASIAGTTVGFLNLAHYCASKGGIMGFTKALSLELAPNIQVNAIAPGAILTPGVESTMDKKSAEAFSNSVPVKRMGSPKDIGQTVAFLASDDADYITGQTILVDGGFTVQ